MNLRHGLAVILALLLCPSAFAQDAKWLRATSPHFLLFTDTTEAKAERLLTDFEIRFAAFSKALFSPHPRQFPIEVFLFKQHQDFMDAVPAPDVTKGEKNAYLWNGPDRIFIAAKDKSPEDIANDVAHALGHALFEHEVMWRPFWLAEGASEYVRRVGRAADTKPVKDSDAFSVEDLLTIVPSAEYNDADASSPFRTQSYRLLRVLFDEQPFAVQDFLKKLKTGDGREAKLDVDVDALAKQYAAYTETPVKAPETHVSVKTEPVAAGEVAIQRGDLLVAAGKTSGAPSFYNANSKEARAARAVLTRYSRMPAEALQTLEQAASELPDFGLVQYHFGALPATNRKDQDLQAAALERAVKLMPEFGRADAELARVYVLTGKAEQALPLLQRAVELEPEFADHFVEIRADAEIALHRFDDAFRSIKLAEALPHADHKAAEAYTVKVMNVTNKIEAARRELESRKVAEMRREVDAKVAQLEPPVKPQPVEHVPEGQVRYEIEARSPIEVIDAVYPEYPEALRRKGSAGKIALRVDVSAEGAVTNVKVAASQLSDLTAATVDAVKKWTFKVPPRARPGATSITLTMIFSLQ